MEFIHETTGSLASFAAYVIAFTGIAVYFFKYIRSRLSIKRSLLVKLHLYAAAFLLTMLIIHYYTTDKSNIFVLTAAYGYFITALFGLALKVKKIKSVLFKKIVILKIVFFAVIVASTLIGHSILEKERHAEISVLMENNQ